jgi:putative membrane protein insertion efficiency factor
LSRVRAWLAVALGVLAQGLRLLVAGLRLAAVGLRLLVLVPIVLYQRVISPGLPRRCRYEPTCSRYAVQAIQRYGILRGLVLAGWRLLRCNPFSHGGFDPVDAQRLFPPRGQAPDARRAS